jgi:hypothetical protein
MNKNGKDQLLALSRIESKIFIVRGQKVMVSSDLAMLYQVQPKALIQAVKRNSSRFPSDFMFQLTRNEARNLKSQFVTSTWGGARRALPYAFTEQGVAMLYCAVNARFRSTLQLCGHSSSCGRYWPHTRICVEKSMKWKSVTIHNFMRFLRHCVRCWKPPCLRSDRSVSMRAWNPYDAVGRDASHEPARPLFLQTLRRVGTVLVTHCLPRNQHKLNALVIHNDSSLT